MQNNWKTLVKPENIERLDLTPIFGRFVAKPLERGYGTTLGNALRRVLLSSLQGAAVVGVKIDGVEHEFSTMSDISEDVTEIVLNLKSLNVVVDNDDTDVHEATIDVVGPKIVTGADVQSLGSVRVLNPDHVICTIAEGGKFRAQLAVKTGKGYATSDVNREGLPLGTIPMDALFSPVRRVAVDVADARVGQRSDYNKLVLEITTNGAVSPEDALSYSAKILKDQLSLFINFQEADDDETHVGAPIVLDAKLNENLYRTIDELELSVRAANCLENVGIRFVGELVTKTEADMLKTKNFGRKTLNEIKDILAEMGMHMGMRIEGFDPAQLTQQKKD
jgi:DNA-directed RNA polymerase subunit alpha